MIQDCTYKIDNMNIRVIKTSDGKIYFVAKEITDIVGFSNGPREVKKLPDIERAKIKIKNKNGFRDSNVVTESGAKKLISSSTYEKKTELLDFIDVVVSEKVKPSSFFQYDYEDEDDCTIEDILPYVDSDNQDCCDACCFDDDGDEPVAVSEAQQVKADYSSEDIPDSFQFRKEYFTVMLDMSTIEKGRFIESLMNVGFGLQEIDEVDFNDRFLNMVWKYISRDMLTTIKSEDIIESLRFNMCDVYGSENKCSASCEDEEVIEPEIVESEVADCEGTVAIHEENDSEKFKDIIEHLNYVAGTKYKTNSKAAIKLIKARLNEGFTVDDFKQVHVIKMSEWKGTEFQKFMRPSTLYGTKFEQYLNQSMSNYEKERVVKTMSGVDAVDVLRQQGYAV